MTYCLGIKLDQHMIFVSDSRTSAGFDNVSTYSKMWRFGAVGLRKFVLCSAGNLATTQAVVTILKNDIEQNAAINLMNIKSLHEGAEYIGKISVECQNKNTGGGPLFETTFLFGGEIAGSLSEMYMIYSQGNFISSSTQVPFLQIGEFKYGKPILDRVIKENTPLERAVVCALVSMDATIKSNIAVGPPIELFVMDIGSLNAGRYLKFEEDDMYLRDLRNAWNSLMQEAMDKLQAPVMNGMP